MHSNQRATVFLARVLISLVLFAEMHTPIVVFAQTNQGETTSTQNPSGGIWPTITNGFNTIMSGELNLIGNLGGNFGFPNIGNQTVVTDVVTGPTNGIINTGIDVIVATGNNLWWPNTSGPTVISNIVDTVVINPIVELVVAITNNWPGNTRAGEPAGTNAAGGDGPLDLTPNGANSNTTANDEDGGAAPSTSNGPRQQGQGSSGPSIPGASKGTVGNPFSDGTDKDDAASNNDETTSNPYLFEYDPNSTNNNPSGAGSLDR